VLVVWIVFVFNGVLYYPYGASRSIHRELMASNLMMWEVIKFGKQQSCKLFDMWGSLGPNPDPKDPWYGFHRFKKGYGGDLVEFVGTFDLVQDYPIYKVYNLANNLRWKVLRLKKKLKL
jgi:lipid II:glycine glycyltransferase (peptidoglycan interpeptide bridge formation enzyme)